MTTQVTPQGATVNLGNEQPSEPRVVLYNLSWESYEQIGDALCDRPALRLTYDGGTLEILTTSAHHEMLKHRLGRFLETLAEEHNLSLLPGGSTTFKRSDLEKGLEPDQCYWIANEYRMQGRIEWDAATDPPPDLVIEVEVTRSAVPRLGIYAALGVPEVWRFDGRKLHVMLLQPDGRYQATAKSPTFPTVPVTEIPRFLQLEEQTGYLGVVREYHTWVRGHLQEKR